MAAGSLLGWVAGWDLEVDERAKASKVENDLSLVLTGIVKFDESKCPASILRLHHWRKLLG